MVLSEPGGAGIRLRYGGGVVGRSPHARWQQRPGRTTKKWKQNHQKINFKRKTKISAIC